MKKADLIIHNARIITLNPARPFAGGVAVKAGRVLAVFDDGYRQYEGKDTEVIDGKGKTVVPGFIDAHCHPVGYAESLVSPDLSSPSVKSIADIQDKIRNAVKMAAPGVWIRARGYHEYYLAEKRHPNRWDLDIAAPCNPVKLTHRSGHAHVLNSMALKMAGILIDTEEPPGGMIERDGETGEPNGILYEMSSYLSGKVPQLGDGELDAAMNLAGRQFMSLGITSVQDASAANGLTRWRDYERWKSQGIFKPRVSMMLGIDAAAEQESDKFEKEKSDNNLRCGAVKILISEMTGKLNPSQETLNEIVLRLHKAGCQVAIHAVGETLVNAAAIALERALIAHPRRDHRHRIEHCSVCRPDMAQRLAAQGILIVTQPAFIYYSGGRYLDTVPPDQIPHLYPAATFLRAGLKVAAGSDCPVVPPDPLKGIYGAVNRMAQSGQLVSYNQAVSVFDAMEMYTSAAAHTSFEEPLKGNITAGKLADMVMLNSDPTTIPVKEIKDIHAEMTIIGGQIVYRHTV